MDGTEQNTQPSPNPLSTVTDPELVAQWIMSNQEKKGTPEFTALGEHLKSLTGQTAPVVTPAPTEDIGFIEGIGFAKRL